MEMLFLIILWHISIVLSFLCGFFVSKGIKPKRKEKPFTNENKEPSIEEIQEQNFWNYDGRPQNINGITR